MIGEDHGIAEIPAFSTALCRTVAPQNYHTLAVETGPSTAAVLAAALAAQNPPVNIAAHDTQHSADLAKAMKSSSLGDMSMVNLKETDLAALKAQLNAAGISTPQLDEVIVSENTYRENMIGNQKWNLDRSRLHRYHFVAGDRAAFADIGNHPKVLAKMGAYHRELAPLPAWGIPMRRFLSIYCTISAPTLRS